MALKLNEKQTAGAFGATAGIASALWALASRFGYGQNMCNWGMQMAGVAVNKTVSTLSWMGVLKLVIVALLGGAVVGWVFAKIWNWAGKQKYF